jgi:NAD-dependent DNA ligase
MNTPNTAQDNVRAQIGMQQTVARRDLQTLEGVVAGICSDGQLQDMEVSYLQSWLSAHAEVLCYWPADMLADRLKSALADGVLTDAERQDLLAFLQELVASDFSSTGSVSAEPTWLPVDDTCNPNFANAGVVHTGVFAYGTRAKCERLTMKLGGMPLDQVSRRTDIVVIGHRVSPAWAHQSYGTKILKAVELKRGGVALEIISERRWIALAKQAGLMG